LSSKVTLTIHGLDADNKLVRADVFVRKLQALLKGLKIADQATNGTLAHQFIVEEMRVSSALVRVREKISGRKRDAMSCVEAYSAAIKAVYDGQASPQRVPPALVSTFKALSEGADKRFRHAEIDFESDNIIRIDDYMLRQSQRALERDVKKVLTERTPFFRGIAIGTFDGVLRVIDSRGELLRATLVTTAGAKEIDCVVKKDRVEDFAQNFDHRVRIEGTAHYESDSALPVRVDVKTVRPIRPNADLRRWKGAFGGSAAMKEDW
jgi:hypothetical protein